MTNKERSKEAAGIRALIAKYSKLSETRSLTSAEYQELYLLQYRLDSLYEKVVNRSVALIYDGQTESAASILESILPK